MPWKVKWLIKSSILKKVLDLDKNKVIAKDFTMVDNKIIRDGNSFNDAEMRLLAYYHSFCLDSKDYSSWNFLDKNVLKELNWSDGKLKRTKQTLKKKGMLLIEKISFDKYYYYIGKQAVSEYLAKKNAF